MIQIHFLNSKLIIIINLTSLQNQKLRKLSQNYLIDL